MASAGQSGEGRELLYATVGSGPTTFWLQARIHGNELHSTGAALQILDLLDTDNPTARLIRENLTVVVIPMYNPDGSEADIRQSTTPTRIDLNRDWENFAQPESIAFWNLWRDVAPQLALDLHHMGQAPIVNGTNDLNQFQIGARSIDPARMTELQWLTNRQMAMVSVDALDQYGLANVAHYPIIDITNAALSRMLMGGTAPAGEQPVMQTPTQGAIFYEVRSVGQKSNGQLENLFRIPTLAVLTAAADGSLSSYDISGYPTCRSPLRVPAARSDTPVTRPDHRLNGVPPVGVEPTLADFEDAGLRLLWPLPATMPPPRAHQHHQHARSAPVTSTPSTGVSFRCADSHRVRYGLAARPLGSVTNGRSCVTRPAHRR